jgi:hypothetical protein
MSRLDNITKQGRETECLPHALENILFERLDSLEGSGGFREIVDIHISGLWTYEGRRYHLSPPARQGIKYRLAEVFKGIELDVPVIRYRDVDWCLSPDGERVVQKLPGGSPGVEAR